MGSRENVDLSTNFTVSWKNNNASDAFVNKICSPQTKTFARSPWSAIIMPKQRRYKYCKSANARTNRHLVPDDRILFRKIRELPFLRSTLERKTAKTGQSSSWIYRTLGGNGSKNRATWANALDEPPPRHEQFFSIFSFNILVVTFSSETNESCIWLEKLLL